ncbi:MAG: nucleotide exchange factor GrpE [Spirochaetaceae bacterium]|nr:nucleotide exchange factor GrpE [Spirochaetaceae bacterium]
MSSKSKKKAKETLEEVTGEEVTIERVVDEDLVKEAAKQEEIKLEGPAKEEPKAPELTPLEEKDFQIAQLQKQLEEARSFADQCKMDMIRKQADLDNYRKRLVREKETHARFANEGIIKDLLDPLDNLDRAITSADVSKDFDTIHNGVKMVNDQLHIMLDKNWGLKKIACQGEEFDPELHEAYMMEQGEDYNKEVVIDELGAGYTLHDRVLRPAKVKVGKPL